MIGPARSGQIAAVIMICQPAWQLAMMMGLPSASGCRSGDFLDKDRLGPTDILDRLPGYRLRQEADEVDGMARAQRDADLAFRLHAPDTRAMTGAGVDHDDRRLRRIGRDVFSGNDAHERVIYRPLQLTAVLHQFGRKGEHVRDLLCGLFAVVVASLAQGVQEQHAALQGIGPIFADRANIGRLIRHRRLHPLRARYRPLGILAASSDDLVTS